MQTSIPSSFELYLFHRTIEESCAFYDAGVNAIIVDFEQRGKADRQAGFDTQINYQTMQDLVALRRKMRGPIFCRVNGPEPTQSEIDEIIDADVQTLILPMVRTLDQIKHFLKCVGGRCETIVMIETLEALAGCGDWSDLGVTQVYVGLNDLGIERGTSFIFTPIFDGLLDRVRADSTSISKFGFGGLTLPWAGSPVPSLYLYQEMARLGCDFTFLRRSFYRDVVDLKPPVAISAIQEELNHARRRSKAQEQKDRDIAVSMMKRMIVTSDV